MLTTDAINDFKDFIDNIIAYAKVTVNGVSEKKVIHRRERLKDGRVAVYVQITPQVSGKATVQRVQLYNKNNKLWADKAVNVTEFEDRYTESRNDDGTITHTPVEGEIIQQGTPQNATNFNHMENGISNATETAALMALSTIHHQQAIADLQGETATVTLKNTQQYPFNNSTQSVALKTERNHMDYTVETEIVDYTGGFPGDIVITDKLLNGFKMAHTGSAKSVTVKVYVKGGFY